MVPRRADQGGARRDLGQKRRRPGGFFHRIHSVRAPRGDTFERTGGKNTFRNAGTRLRNFERKAGFAFFRNYTEARSRQTEDVGEIIALSIKNFFEQEQTLDIIAKLKEAGVNTEKIVEELIDNRFEGQTFVLTGTLEKYSRDEASKIIERFGGKTSSSVSKKTSYVLAGSEAGSKLDKARSLGVNIISEDEFEEMIK